MERSELIRLLQEVYNLLGDSEDENTYEAWEIVLRLITEVQNGPVQN